MFGYRTIRDFIDTPLHREKGIAVYGGAFPTPELVAQVKEWTEFFAQNGYHIVTGGGPGVMDAARQGAQNVGGTVIGTGMNKAKWLPENHIKFQKEYQRFIDNPTVTQRFENPNGFYGSAASHLVFPGTFGSKAETFRIVYDLMAGTTQYPIGTKVVIADLDDDFTTWAKSQFTEKNKVSQFVTYVKTPEEALEIFKNAKSDHTKSVVKNNEWYA